MQSVFLAHEVDFQGWRNATRRLISDQISPDSIQWHIQPPKDLFTRPYTESTSDKNENLPAFKITRRVFELCQTVIQANEPERFDLLYRWITLCQNHADPFNDKTHHALIHRIERLVQAVQAETSRLRDLLRFHKQSDRSELIAFFEPTHYVIEANSDFFQRLQADQSWLLITPYRSLKVNGQQKIFGPGFSSNPLKNHDADQWNDFLNDFFPKDQPLQKQYYWQELPQAALPKDEVLSQTQSITPLASSEEAITSVPTILKNVDFSMIKLAQTAAECQRCALWKPATQTVFGEGCAKSRLMLVGEQPGDQEDRFGRPFVGPAGQVMNHAIAHAGFERQDVYTTNAVKHFKFTPRGQRRIHQSPNPKEIAACSFWLEAEREIVKPTVLLMLGASAARSILGRPVTISRERSQFIPLNNDTIGMITVHPSYLLRLPDRESKKREYWRFVEDLKKAYTHLG